MDNEKKLNYEEAKIEFVVFETKDILTTSGFEGEWDDIPQKEWDDIPENERVYK